MKHVVKYKLNVYLIIMKIIAIIKIVSMKNMIKMIRSCVIYEQILITVLLQKIV